MRQQYEGTGIKINAYMLIKVRKGIELLLSSSNIDDLKEYEDKSKGIMIVEYFQLVDGKEYIVMPKPYKYEYLRIA